MLADFGLVRVTTISTKILNEEERVLPFTAPELLSTKFGLDRAVPSNEADIFALGMTIYQVLTGKVPLSQVGDAWIMQAVISGERPPKPEDADQIGMTDVVWDLLTECWREDRAKRPNISNILKRFCDITGQGKTTDSKLGLAAPGMHIGASHDSIRSDTQCEWDYSLGRLFPIRQYRTDGGVCRSSSLCRYRWEVRWHHDGVEEVIPRLCEWIPEE